MAYNNKLLWQLPKSKKTTTKANKIYWSQVNFIINTCTHTNKECIKSVVAVGTNYTPQEASAKN